jgi:hypothetical protein
MMHGSAFTLTFSGNIVGACHSLYAAIDARQMLSEGIQEGTPHYWD